MRVILVDDEKATLLIMSRMLSKFQEIELAGVFQSSSEAYSFIRENNIDMAFLDIRMPEENGLNLARRIASEFPGLELVFLTSYKKYALDAFDIHAFDYLVKPVSQERLEDTIKRAMQKHALLPKTSVKESLPKLSVYCLGGMEIHDNNDEIVKLYSSKSFELLAYLIYNKGKFVSKWNVMENVFPGMPVYNAETYLNTTVYKLRKALASYGMNAAVISSNESYRVEFKEIYIDYIDFEIRMNALSQISDCTVEEALKAEKLYEGELFGDRGYFWSIAEKERISVTYFDLCKKIIKYFFKNKNYTQALQILKKIEYKNELDEEVNCLLMELYAYKKDKLALIRQYNKYAKVLKTELRISPGKDTALLYATLIKSFD